MSVPVQLSLIVRGQHRPGDIAAHLKDDLELVRRAEELGFDGIVKGSHYSAHPFQMLQLVPMLARFTRQAVPDLHVLAYDEVPDDRQIRMVGAIA